MSKSLRSPYLNHFNSKHEKCPDTLLLASAEHFDGLLRTPWLGSILGPLGAALDLRLRALPTKVSGRSRIADLLACEDDDGSRVLVKDGFDFTEHTRLLARFSQCDVRTMIWVAERFEAGQLDEVRRLNDITDDEYSFIAARVRLEPGDGGLQPVFDVMQGPAEWVPPLTHLGPIKQLGFPEGFWAFHLHRHSEEARRSHQMGPRCRLRATQLKGIMIGQFVQEDAAFMFLRGRRGPRLEEDQATLEPFMESIEERLGSTFCSPESGVLVARELRINAQWSSNLCAMSDWFWSGSDLLAHTLP